MSTHETILDVRGMTCGSCVRHVDGALRKLEGVSDVQVDLRAGKVRVVRDAERVPVETLVRTIERAGYEASLVAS